MKEKASSDTVLRAWTSLTLVDSAPPQPRFNVNLEDKAVWRMFCNNELLPNGVEVYFEYPRKTTELRSGMKFSSKYCERKAGSRHDGAYSRTGSAKPKVRSRVAAETYVQRFKYSEPCDVLRYFCCLHRLQFSNKQQNASNFCVGAQMSLSRMTETVVFLCV